jgi:DNA invertase Pin-like site-specific DNA recombinase
MPVEPPRGALVEPAPTEREEPLGYEILERFHEEGESAKSTHRSQLQNLLTFCRLNKGRVHFVVVFNLTRFARDKYDHFALRSHLQSLGISLRSATEPIDDTSTGKLMEGVLAAFAHSTTTCVRNAHWPA